MTRPVAVATIKCRHCKRPIVRCADQASHAGCGSGYGWIHAEPYWGHPCFGRGGRSYAQPEEAVASGH